MKDFGRAGRDMCDPEVASSLHLSPGILPALDREIKDRTVQMVMFWLTEEIEYLQGLLEDAQGQNPTQEGEE